MAEFKQCESCERTTDNLKMLCPARMSDGRFQTNYFPRCQTEYLTQIKTNIPSSYDYRQFLIHNGADFIEKNATEAYMRGRCLTCVNPYETGTMLPELEKMVCNSRTCTFKGNDGFGLGLGRQFNTDEQSEVFQKQFSEERTKERDFFKNKAECCGLAKDDLEYYPVNGVVNSEYERYAVPSGGSLMFGGGRLANNSDYSKKTVENIM